MMKSLSNLELISSLEKKVKTIPVELIFYDKAILSTLWSFMKNLVIVFSMMVACKNDTAHLCKEMKTLDTQKACLKENYSKLSDGCKKVITPM